MSDRVLLLGATGTIGWATARALARARVAATALIRHGSTAPPEIAAEVGDLADEAALTALMRTGGYDAVISCIASRTGAPADAWAVDHDANLRALNAAKTAGIGRFVLLSAICVQKPLLEFQRAKLAFEKALEASGLAYSIVRPTAYFKSLSGQIERVKAGKPFLIFGDGRLTACKPISDADLGDYLVRSLSDPSMENLTLPIGGSGPAITPREQGEALFALLGREPNFRSVPVAMMDAVIGGLRIGGTVSKRLKDKAEFARTGRYYATESMLLWDAAKGAYDAAATPEFGSETLVDFYRKVLAGEARVDLGDHAVF
ncbi:MAG: NAD(P)H-binding protein [Pseudomonadota bacterium]